MAKRAKAVQLNGLPQRAHGKLSPRLVKEIEAIFFIQADKDAGRLGQVARKTKALKKLNQLL